MFYLSNYLNNYDHFFVHGQVQSFTISTSLLSIVILDHKVIECIFLFAGVETVEMMYRR